MKNSIIKKVSDFFYYVISYFFPQRNNSSNTQFFASFSAIRSSISWTLFLLFIGFFSGCVIIEDAFERPIDNTVPFSQRAFVFAYRSFSLLYTFTFALYIFKFQIENGSFGSMVNSPSVLPPHHVFAVQVAAAINSDPATAQILLNTAVLNIDSTVELAKLFNSFFPASLFQDGIVPNFTASQKAYAVHLLAKAYLDPTFVQRVIEPDALEFSPGSKSSRLIICWFVFKFLNKFLFLFFFKKILFLS